MAQYRSDEVKHKRLVYAVELGSSILEPCLTYPDCQHHGHLHYKRHKPNKLPVANKGKMNSCPLENIPKTEDNLDPVATVTDVPVAASKAANPA